MQFKINVFVIALFALVLVGCGGSGGGGTTTLPDDPVIVDPDPMDKWNGNHMVVAYDKDSSDTLWACQYEFRVKDGEVQTGGIVWCADNGSSNTKEGHITSATLQENGTFRIESVLDTEGTRGATIPITQIVEGRFTTTSTEDGLTLHEGVSTVTDYREGVRLFAHQLDVMLVEDFLDYFEPEATKATGNKYQQRMDKLMAIAKN